MIHKRIPALALAGGIALGLAVPAAAQSVDFKPIEAKNIASGKQKIDPAKGYILITSSMRSVGTIIKNPDADEIAEYEAEWEKEFAKAQKKYVKAVKQYEIDKKAGLKSTERPVEPTRQNFSIGGIDRRMTATFGPQFVYEKDTESEVKSFTFLTELEPGTYAYYGPVMAMPNGQAFGACYCMGTVKFEVKAGEITNLGNFLSQTWASDADIRATAAIMPGEPGRVPVPAVYPVPASLSAYKVVTADWRASGKLNNFYGITVSRHPTVPGVLGYERDKVIDLRARAEQAEAPANPVPSEGTE